MENGATFAYKRIDAKVDETLLAAAKILRVMKIEKDEEEEKMKKEQLKKKGKEVVGTRVDEISCTSVETRGTISIGTVHRSSKEPKATIRTPTDSMKSRKSVNFPPATIKANGRPRTPSAVSGSCVETYCDLTDVPSTPELFPNAVYIPAGSKVSKMPITTRRAQASASAQSVYRMQIQKLAIEPLDDISYLKCRGVKKSKPDEMFPSATYVCGTGKANLAISPVTSVVSVDSSNSSSTSSCMSTAGETTSTASAYLPMEFVSTDGRLKMLLKPLEEKTSASKNKNQKEKKISKKSEEEFPIVPTQLQSCTKLKTFEEKRMKFLTKFSFFNNSIDLSGIVNGAKKGGKLVINGQHYSF